MTIPAKSLLNFQVTVPSNPNLYLRITDILIYNDTEFHKVLSGQAGFGSYWAIDDLEVRPNGTVQAFFPDGGTYHIGFAGSQSQNANPAAFTVYSQPTVYLGIPVTQALGLGVAAVAAALGDAVSESRSTTSRILVSRFREGAYWFVRVRCMEGTIDACSARFDKTPLITKDKQQQVVQMAGGEAVNWTFWAADPPQKDDQREIAIMERGRRIFHRPFSELTEAVDSAHPPPERERLRAERRQRIGAVTAELKSFGLAWPNLSQRVVSESFRRGDDPDISRTKRMGESIQAAIAGLRMDDLDASVMGQLRTLASDIVTLGQRIIDAWAPLMNRQASLLHELTRNGDSLMEGANSLSGRLESTAADAS
jgi:hypothetical protein